MLFSSAVLAPQRYHTLFEQRMLLVSPQVSASHRELQLDIVRVLAHLVPRDRTIIMLRFGLIAHSGKATFKEIGAMFNISGSAVRQLMLRAMRKLQGPYFTQMLSGHLD